MTELGRSHTNVRACISSTLMAFAQLMHELLLLINTCTPFNRQTVMQMSPDPLRSATEHLNPSH